MSPAKESHTPAPETRRLTQYRRWHKWGGVIAGLFLLVLGTSGIVLNYKQPIFTTFGLPTKRDRDASPFSPSPKSAGVKFTTDGITGGTVTFDQALQVAKGQWGDTAIERAEIRAERGSVTFRIRSAGGEELWVDASDGIHATKGEYERISRNKADGKTVVSTDWGKILIDLHTGRIGGEAGKAIMSVAALLLVLLTLSGVYLWLKPLLLRRENTRNEVTGARANPANSTAPARERKWVEV